MARARRDPAVIGLWRFSWNPDYILVFILVGKTVIIHVHVYRKLALSCCENIVSCSVYYSGRTLSTLEYLLRLLYFFSAQLLLLQVWHMSHVYCICGIESDILYMWSSNLQKVAAWYVISFTFRYQKHKITR